MVSPVVAIVTITIIGTRAFLPQTSCSFQYIVLPWCLEQSQYPLNVPKIPVDGLTGCNLSFQIYKGEPKNLEFIYEKLCIYSYIFKLHSPSKYSPFDTLCLSRHFSHCSKYFLNSWILMPFSAPAVISFTSFTSAKCFPLRTFFI